jgi:hypothetical protein
VSLTVVSRFDTTDDAAASLSDLQQLPRSANPLSLLHWWILRTGRHAQLRVVVASEGDAYEWLGWLWDDPACWSSQVMATPDHCDVCQEPLPTEDIRWTADPDPANVASLHALCITCADECNTKEPTS